MSAGKDEIMVTIFVIASNDFMTQHHDDKQEDTHLEVPANQPAVARDKPKWRRCAKY
jgi:hypothetical protein